MNRPAFPLLVIFFGILAQFVIIIHADATTQPSYVPTVNTKGQNCNIPSVSPQSDGSRTHLDTPKRVARVSSGNLSSTASPQACALIYHTKHTEQFSVGPGPMFVRLHFYPISYEGLSISNAIFSVSIGNYTLLHTTPTSYAADHSSGKPVVREYIIDIQEETLNLTFTPSDDSPHSYAFVNMIEVVSMPMNLYIREEVQFPLTGNSSRGHDHTKVLETAYRINVGGPSIPSGGDTGMLRQWFTDDDYITSPKVFSTMWTSQIQVIYNDALPNYTAPAELYLSARTSNLVYDNMIQDIAWTFWVESGFSYLIRLHFCDIIGPAGEVSGRTFKIHINNTSTAEDHAHTISLAGQPVGTPIYKDYTINASRPAPGCNITLESLRISLSSYSVSPGVYRNPGILNGLEIFKMPDSEGSLAGEYPFGTAFIRDLPPSNEKFMFVLLLAVVYVSTSCFVCLICLEVLQKSRTFWTSCQERISGCINQSSGYTQCFSLEMIKLATNNFSDDLLIGIGGFGKVYKGLLEDGVTTVAVKRANAGSIGFQEFQTEISLLAKLRHRHLVSLLGYCMEDKEMILIYNFMEQGNLRENLYRTWKGPRNTELTWKQRLEICIGAARGLHHLHTGIKPPVIHRDVKSSNILLDHNWEAKISDFGLSKTGSQTMMFNSSFRHINTAVRGTFGYVDPEYFRRMGLTEKSDVYSFGVVLFEVLCARPAVISARKDGDEDDQIKTLAEWISELHAEDNLEQAIDPQLRGTINQNCLGMFVDIGMKCLEGSAKDRPSMGEVLSCLELAWRQQCTAESRTFDGTVDDQISVSGNSDKDVV